MCESDIQGRMDLKEKAKLSDLYGIWGEYDSKYDWKKELEPNSDQLEPDSREKIESEIHNILHCISITAKGKLENGTFEFGFVDGYEPLLHKLLDRQSAITWQKMDDTWAAQKTEIADLRRKLDELEQESTVGGGTAEDWYRVVQKDTAKIDELQAKLDKMEYELSIAPNCEDCNAFDEADQATAENASLTAELNDYDETHMKLPLDADGVPIRIGDTVQYVNDAGGTGAFVEVCAVSDCYAYYGEGKHFYRADCCRHVNQRTIEDVLQELEGLRGYGNSTYEDVVTRAAELAAEIREIMEVDA